MSNQEQIVDGFIADYLETRFAGVKEKLSQTSKYFKRGAKASIMGKDRKIYELIKSLEEKNQSEAYLTYFDELVIAYRKYVEVADVEKKTLGEVMTPITLVEEMLDTLPSDVWSNPNLKWLDPCAGVGTFPSIVVQRLMKGLEGFEKNPIKRYRHIIEEMIYVCELQPKNLFVYHCVFDKDDTNELNTYCGSFLDENFDKHMSDVWGVEKFDIIIGNPPYQTQKAGNTKTQPIWHFFVEKSINTLSKDGYLSMVHPSNWRDIDAVVFKKVKKLMMDKTIHYLELHDIRDGLKTFKAKTTYDFYCLQNTPNENHKTKIKCIDGSFETINITDYTFIPNGKFEELNDLIALETEEKVTFLHSYSAYETRKDYMNDEMNNEFKYPCVVSTYADGSMRTIYSKTNENGHFGLPKVIFSFGGGSTPIIDYKGEYGLTQFAFAIVDDVANLEKIQKALASKEFLTLIEYSWGMKGQLKYNNKLMSTFRKDFYKQFLND